MGKRDMARHAFTVRELSQQLAIQRLEDRMFAEACPARHVEANAVASCPEQLELLRAGEARA